MRRDEDFFQHFEGHTLFTGVCECRNDPAMLGRVQVRIFGLHSPDRTEIPTEALPWATVMLPTTMAGMSGIGATSPGIMEGSWVVGFFRDGPSCQDPIIIGTLLGNASPKWPALSRSDAVQSSDTMSEKTDENKKELMLDDKGKEIVEEIEQEKSTDLFSRIKQKWDDLTLKKKLSDLTTEDKKELEKASDGKLASDQAVDLISKTDPTVVKEIQSNGVTDLEEIQKMDRNLLQKTKSLSDEELDNLIEQKKRLETV
jgi:hypothetical protein